LVAGEASTTQELGADILFILALPLATNVFGAAEESVNDVEFTASSNFKASFVLPTLVIVVGGVNVAAVVDRAVPFTK
jgi:hypothetical protein